MIGALTATATAGGTTSLPIDTPTENPIFNQEQCLFCNKSFGTFESNIVHMQKAHGLFVPDRKRLIVDLETLFSYLHLVIVGYNECICCGTQRSSTLAVQQHMIGKGHCKFDIASDDSEYADFYDFSGSEAESEEDEGSDADDEEDNTSKPRKGKTETQTVQLDDNSLRLPSGRVISNRSQPQSHTRRQLLRSRSPELIEATPANAPDTQEQAEASTSTPQSGKSRLALTRAEKQENKFSKQLAALSRNDERSLAHLTLPQQRAVLATTQKQVEKAKRAEEKYRGRLEGLGNQFLMTHFVKDAADKRTLWR